jgi:hypothetical protein
VLGKRGGETVSGGYDEESGGRDEETQTHAMVKVAMGNYRVDEETAARIIADRNVFALKRFEKWRLNYLKLLEKGKSGGAK